MTLQSAAIDKLKTLGEDHLIENVCSLNEVSLYAQILAIDEKIFFAQRKTCSMGNEEKTVSPLKDFHQKGNPCWADLGEELIQKGKVAALIVAGGQGSRLGFEGPKGCFPITAVRKKSLFQFFAEKVRAASDKHGLPLKVAVMVSPANSLTTQHFFSTSSSFGLLPSQLSFFEQPELPFLDAQGHLLLQGNVLTTGPNGNGAVFSSFVASGLFDEWRREGIEYVLFLQIDNPLGDPFDAELVGGCCSTNSDAVIKAVERKNRHEKVGLIVRKEEKIGVVEYSELSEMQKASSNFHLANISSFCFRLEFMKRAAMHPLPLHCQKKKTDAQSEAWKFEHYVFDALPLAERVEVIAYPRDETFAPLKNFYGEDSIISVQAALALFDRKVCTALTGKPFPREGALLELDPRFYYPTERIKEKWRGKEVGEGYLEA